MSLPPAFVEAEEYFEECMEFLTRYRDLYWKSNTDVLTDDLDFHVQLHDADGPSEGIDLSVYSDVFLRDLKKLAPCYESFTDKGTSNNVQSPMSQKKAHEVAYLAEEIKNMCRAVDCETVVDLGAGLGYIDLQLFVKTGFNVLGLEGKESFYVNAKEHQRKYHSESLSKVKYIRHVISENSDTNIASYLKDKFPGYNNGFCFMGLHACGDLTVSAIDLFIKMRNSRALVVTPCCYHKMAARTDNERRFKNFPLSETLKKIFEKFDGYDFLDIPFLRVAAQPAYIRDEDIQDRVFYLLARALLKVYAKKYNCRVQKIRRKAVRHHLVKNDFVRYAEEATTKGFKLVPITDSDPENKDPDGKISVEFNLKELQSMWEKIPKTTFTNAALYISFQNHLPPIFENLILFDRIVYLKENGINDCHVRKVVNEKISPKCLSLFASKENVHPS